MKAYTYNDRLVGVGNDQILGTDQGGGSTYTAGNGIDITNDVISVDDTVAMVSALPTTELGKFTIQSNVSGGPIEVICPTDQGHPIETVILDNTAVSGTTGSGTSSVYIVYKSPGYDSDYYTAEGSAILHIPEAVSGLANLKLVYALNSNPVSYNGPSFTNPQYIYGDSTGGRYVLDAGDYDINVIPNAVSQSQGGYGKYITLYAAGPAPDVQALLKSSFSLAVRHPELGITVNLDRYALGNTNTITNTSSYPQAYVYTDPVTKKQSVYLPSSAPYSWNLKTAILFQYGNSSFGYSNADTSHDYIAYKYNSTTRNYEFAELVNTDYNAKKFTFARAYNGAIEYWVADCTNGYYSTVWSTETNSYEAEIQAVSGALDNYIPYSASGVYLPNSKFEIDTEGQAYKLVSEASESNYNHFDDGGIRFSDVWTQLGTYKAILPSNVDHISIANNPGADVTGTYDIATHTAIINVNVINNAGSTVYAYDNNNKFIGLDNSNTTVKYIVPAVTEEYLTDGDLELNDNNQVTAIDGHALAGTGGTTYTAGQYISIDSNDVISVTGITPGSDSYVKVITDSSSTSQVTYGDLRALCEGHTEFDLFYDATVYNRRYIYRCSRAARVGSHFEVCFTTVPISSEYEQSDYDNGKYSNTVIDIYFWFWKVDSDGPSDDTIAYVGSDNVPGVINHNFSWRGIQVDWNETNSAAQTYIKNKPDLSQYATDIEVSQAIASSIVQSDWAVTAVDSPAYIENKPETLEMELSPVTGGNCISITEGNAGSIDWITTAGITDIVSVTALPANPVATVIYLIPET